MFHKKLIVISLLIVGLLSAFSGKSFAVTTPNFPACSNPQGQQIANYTTGTHGVPGNTNTYTGSDSVYAVGEGTLTQCLCTTNGDGIQTNWWKVSSLTQEEKQILLNEGWVLIPDGSVWGLEKAEYLAKNFAYTCREKSNPGGPGDGLSDGRSDGRSSCPECTKAPRGQVLGINTYGVLGLANTGNTLFIISVLVLGMILLTSGIVLSLNKKK